jgi:ERCC4-type nuclease
MSKTIIVDTREQKPYTFRFFADANTKVVNRKLQYGDYSIEGLEDKIAIERKATPSEIARNFGVDKKRFYREIEVLSDFDHAVFLCEFTLQDAMDFPHGRHGLPRVKRKYVRMNGKYLAKCLYGLEEKYGLELVFCEDARAAEQWAFEFLQQKAQEYGV